MCDFFILLRLCILPSHLYFMCLNILPACMRMYHMHAWCLHKPENRLNALELVLQMVVNHHVGGCELNPGPLQE